MASVDQIREAIKTTVEANIPSLHAYKYVPEAANVLPAVVIIPFTSDFAQAMGRGLDQWIFDLLVLVSASDDQVRQAELDSYVTGAGSKSIREMFWNNKGLGRTDCDAYVSEMTEYGMRFPVAEIDHIGARLKLIVHTTGSS